MFQVVLAVCLSGTPVADCGERSPDLLSWTVLGEARNELMCAREAIATIARTELIREGDTWKVLCRRHTQVPSDVG